MCINIGADACRRIEAIVRYVRAKLPNTDVLLLGLPPRGRSGFTQPSVFTGAIKGINARLQ